MRLLWVFLLTTAVLIKNIEGSGGKSSWEGGNSWKGGKGWKGGKDHWKGGKGWKGGSWKGGKASPLEACPKGKNLNVISTTQIGWVAISTVLPKNRDCVCGLTCQFSAIRNIWGNCPRSSNLDVIFGRTRDLRALRAPSFARSGTSIKCCISDVWIPPRKNQQKTYCNIISQFSDVVDTAATTPGFKTLVKLVKDFDLVDTLKKANAVTIFAPTDDAFDKLPPGTLKKLTKQEAKEVLLT